MNPEPLSLVVSTAKPKGRVARMLAEMGVKTVPITEDEGEEKA